MRYTLRNLPKELDRVIRERARRESKSFDEVVIDALSRAFGIHGEPAPARDLSDIAGTWQDDPEMDRVLAEQRRVDPQFWR